jgi:hypothetical protein
VPSTYEIGFVKDGTQECQVPQAPVSLELSSAPIPPEVGQVVYRDTEGTCIKPQHKGTSEPSSHNQQHEGAISKVSTRQGHGELPPTSLQEGSWAGVVGGGGFLRGAEDV